MAKFIHIFVTDQNIRHCLQKYAGYLRRSQANTSVIANNEVVNAKRRSNFGVSVFHRCVGKFHVSQLHAVQLKRICP